MHPQHVQDRINARTAAVAKFEAMCAAGDWYGASDFHEREIAPLNDWLSARGVW